VDHWITCGTRTEYGRKQGKLIVRKLIWHMTRRPVEFSTGVILVTTYITQHLSNFLINRTVFPQACILSLTHGHYCISLNLSPIYSSLWRGTPPNIFKQKDIIIINNLSRNICLWRVHYFFTVQIYFSNSSFHCQNMAFFSPHIWTLLAHTFNFHILIQVKQCTKSLHCYKQQMLDKHTIKNDTHR
jgi:hypothetical protein